MRQRELLAQRAVLLRLDAQARVLDLEARQARVELLVLEPGGGQAVAGQHHAIERREQRRADRAQRSLRHSVPYHQQEEGEPGVERHQGAASPFGRREYACHLGQSLWLLRMTFPKSSRCSRILPAPSTTQVSGSCATRMLRFVTSRSRRSSPRSSAPPPVRKIPLSTISAASSGGVRSRDSRTALTMLPIGS